MGAFNARNRANREGLESAVKHSLWLEEFGLDSEPVRLEQVNRLAFKHTSSPHTAGSKAVTLSKMRNVEFALIAYFPFASVVSSSKDVPRTGIGGFTRSVSRKTAATSLSDEIYDSSARVQTL